MAFNPEMAETRFGCGLSPVHRPAQSVDEMLARLNGPDRAAQTFPIPLFDTLRPEVLELRKIRKKLRSGSEDERLAAKDGIKKIRKTFGARRRVHLSYAIGRRATTEDAFRERLAFFWADHFTAKGNGLIFRRSAPTYWEEAIRPNLTGSFRDLLVAAVTHPLMLLFLDQSRSIGPNSQVARKRNKDIGLNENLAREVLELHTLGVNGPYTQKDVRQLAELFTGLSFQPRKGFYFRKAIAEPGAENILGKYYGGDPALLKHVHDVLTDLARHPATARHIAWKLAVHFVSDRPDLGLVDAIADRFLETDGDLNEVYRAMLEHPASWSRDVSNVKQPIEFVSSALRALAVPATRLKRMKNRNINRHLLQPLVLMGQNWDAPLGPDGWPEEDANWMTAQAMAARMQWALAAPQALTLKLPDPRQFAVQALGSDIPDTVQFAAKAAESKWEGVALVLVSPSFQRR